MDIIGQIAYSFLKVRNHMKIFHWQTKNYAQHIASDSFITTFDTLSDTFIETLQGSKNQRLSIKTKFKMFNINSKTITKILYYFRKFIKYELIKVIKNDTELINIRDEMLQLVNKTFYLFTLQ
jgi:hypothetical protein